MAELTVPQVDFSALGQLPQIYQQGRSDAIRRQTLANLGQGGETDATTLLKSGDLSLAQLGINIKNHQDELARQAAADARQSARDKIGDQHWAASYALQKRAAERADDVTPAGFVKNADGSYAPLPGGPKDPAYLAKVAEIDAQNSKPIPVETLGGTKFLVRSKDGSMSLVDPSTMGQPSSQSQPASQIAQQSGASPQSTTEPATPLSAQPNIETIDEKTGRRESYLQSLDPQVRDYVKKVADYEIDPRTTSVKGGMREKLLSAVAKYDPSYNQNDFTARSKAIKDFSTGPQGNIVRSFDVAIDHLDTLQKAATAMQNGDIRILNSLRNKWREETGSDLPTDFKALVPLVSGEIAKAVIGSNNALSDREELRHNLQNANSPAQITGVITGYKGLMSGQLKGLRKQYESATGKKDFDSKLREHTLKELSGGDKAAPVTIDGYTIKEN